LERYCKTHPSGVALLSKTPSLQNQIVLFCEFTKDVNWKFKLLFIIILILTQFVRNPCNRYCAASNARKVTVQQTQFLTVPTDDKFRLLLNF